jgi:nucleoside-diphosphate-sugar epimerase
MADRNERWKMNPHVLWRVLADIAFVNASLALALGLRLLFGLFWQERWRELAELRATFAGFYYLSAPALCACIVFLFNFYGVYDRTRFYARRRKALVLFQAVTLAYLLFIFILYFISREITLVPRSVFVLSYAFTMILAAGTRLAMNFAASRYDLVPKPANGNQREIRNVLVVGGAGYIGSVLVRQLLLHNYHVRVLDVGAFGSSSLDEARRHPRFELVEGDLRHVEHVVRAVRGTDAVVHLGAIVGDPACELDAQATREINTIATRMLVQVCRGAGVGRLLFASTCAVYGASDHLVDEHSALNPVSTYAESKADAERIVLAASSGDFATTVLRLGTAFGHSPRPRFDLVVNLLTARAWRDQRITIFNPEQWRPFVHVQDIARAFVTCLKANSSIVSGEVFNVGDYQLNKTLGDVAEEVKSQLPNTQVEIRETPDRRNYRVSFDKIHSYLGFRAERTLADGVREVIEFLSGTPCDPFADKVFDNAKLMKDGSVLTAPLPDDLPLVTASSATGHAARVVAK